jgi:hypothetical protein
MKKKEQEGKLNQRQIHMPNGHRNSPHPHSFLISTRKFSFKLNNGKKLLQSTCIFNWYRYVLMTKYKEFSLIKFGEKLSNYQLEIML